MVLVAELVGTVLAVLVTAVVVVAAVAVVEVAGTHAGLLIFSARGTSKKFSALFQRCRGSAQSIVIHNTGTSIWQVYWNGVSPIPSTSGK